MFLRRPGRNPVWVVFKHERLPNICYRCGTLNHESRNCSFQAAGKEIVFGSWLRAEDPSENVLRWSEMVAETNNHVVVSMSEVGGRISDASGN